MTREKAKARAQDLDARIDEQLGARVYGSARRAFSEIRAYLIRRSEELDTKNNPIYLLKIRQEQNGMALIALGPTFDKGPTPQHFNFDSGGRLSFGLTLREEGHRAELTSFRFHYEFPDNRVPRFIRFDLNESPHQDPIREPRCHLHPGIEEVRIPISLLDPLEILDRIFFAIDAHL